SSKPGSALKSTARQSYRKIWTRSQTPSSSSRRSRPARRADRAEPRPRVQRTRVRRRSHLGARTQDIAEVVVNEHKQALLKKIEDGTFHVGIIGMGYVGLPLALTFIERAKFKVTGFDVDQR